MHIEIGLLTESLQQEIVANPDNFYLTFDIYDLLFDWLSVYQQTALLSIIVF